jgi:hypothetical protein
MEEARFHQKCFEQAFWLPASGADVHDIRTAS